MQRTIVATLLLITAAATGATVTLIESKARTFQMSVAQEIDAPATPFPVGVDPTTKEISEHPLVADYYDAYLQSNRRLANGDSWWDHLANSLAAFEWYQQLAAPVSRILVIWPGQRREEVVDHFGDILRWSPEERAAFSELVSGSTPALPEGMFAPGRYVAHREATPGEVAPLLQDRFANEILERYPPEVEEQVPLEDALIIASLLEREARDFTDMRMISGIIWNRLFIDMPLQLDATLQYARGSRPSEAAWWPRVVPRDKYISSPYNTYANSGLPPAPIANPSPEAVLAALNPRETSCLFYFHDARRNFHCSDTYAGHVSLLRHYYGQGK